MACNRLAEPFKALDLVGLNIGSSCIGRQCHQALQTRRRASSVAVHDRGESLRHGRMGRISKEIMPERIFYGGFDVILAEIKLVPVVTIDVCAECNSGISISLKLLSSYFPELFR
jgi:hypothetical protein